MPGTVIFSTPVAVFPGTLSKAFTETQTYTALVSEYHDGSSQTGARVSAPRHSWKLAKRLNPAGMTALSAFIALHIADTFYFYNPKETSPANTWDATGAATAGRYTVRINSDWSESIGLARTDAAVELIEVGPATLIGIPGTTPPANLPCVNDDAYLRTGLWFANPTAAGGDSYPGETADNESAVLLTTPVNRGVYGSQLARTGHCSLATTTPGRAYDTYPHVVPQALLVPPIAGFSASAIDASRVECALASVQYSHHSAALLGSIAWITVWSDPEYQYTHLFSYHIAYDGSDETSLRAFLIEGHGDTTGSTIPQNILAYCFNLTIWNTTYQPPVAGALSTLDAEDAVMVLFFQAIRVNCGEAAGNVTRSEPLFPANPYGDAFSGVYAYLPDQGFDGGEVYASGHGVALYDYGRTGTEFIYIFGRNLFADIYPACAYDLAFGVFEWQGAAVGERIFSVLVSGDGVTWITAIVNLDIRSAHGLTMAEAKASVTIASWPDGKLYIKFVASVGEACCNYIRVTPKWL